MYPLVLLAIFVKTPSVKAKPFSVRCSWFRAELYDISFVEEHEKTK